ncbi:MAG: hypothetical protein J0J04_04830 [Microbacterium sp.]|uniref:hypothetical protein n=1 Tax=Microbacterium sp. TaxID=51671 RepID=UPI001AC7EAE3|nr:hypothetical protein [Microbacterium sp.]MBN9214133.1 hypothetical protein [Microbacterium sp.]
MIDSAIPDPWSVAGTIAVALGASTYVVTMVLTIRALVEWVRTFQAAGRFVAGVGARAQGGYVRATASAQGRTRLTIVAGVVAAAAVWVCARWVMFSLRQDLPYPSGWPERFRALLGPVTPDSLEMIITWCFIGAAACYIAAAAAGSSVPMVIAAIPMAAVAGAALLLAVLIGGAGLVTLILGGLGMLVGRGGRTEEYWTTQELPEILGNLDSGWQLLFAGILYSLAAATVAWALQSGAALYALNLDPDEAAHD